MENKIDIVHTFTVGNYGPSPAKTNISFLIPIIKLGKEDLLEFIEVTVSFIRGVLSILDIVNYLNIYCIHLFNFQTSHFIAL